MIEVGGHLQRCDSILVKKEKSLEIKKNIDYFFDTIEILVIMNHRNSISFSN